MAKKLTVIGVIAAIVMVSLYIGSPYYAASRLKSAAMESDTDAIEAGVDFASVQSSLKSQMTIALTRQLQNDPQMKSNPFAGLGMVMLPAIIDKAVGMYVTPEGVSALMKGNKPGTDQTGEPEGNLDKNIEYSTEWSGLNRFRVHTRNKNKNQKGPTFLFERRGLLTWSMIKIELSDEFFERK